MKWLSDLIDSIFGSKKPVTPSPVKEVVQPPKEAVPEKPTTPVPPQAGKKKVPTRNEMVRLRENYIAHADV